MSEEIRDDMSFEEMLKATEANANVYTGKIVKAKVISVSPTECIVGVDGSKHTGIVPLREMSHDPNAKMEDLVKEGDELDLVVVKTNDQEGVDTLSRVRFEAQKGMKDVSEAAENGTVMEGDVMEANKGGVVVNVKGVRVLFPVLRPPCAVTRTTPSWLASTFSWSLPSAQPQDRRLHQQGHCRGQQGQARGVLGQC